MNIIKSLINKICCCHNWRIIYDMKHIDDFGGYYTKRTLFCTKCGKIKQIIL